MDANMHSQRCINDICPEKGAIGSDNVGISCIC